MAVYVEVISLHNRLAHYRHSSAERCFNVCAITACWRGSIRKRRRSFSSCSASSFCSLSPSRVPRCLNLLVSKISVWKYRSNNHRLIYYQLRWPQKLLWLIIYRIYLWDFRSYIYAISYCGHSTLPGHQDVHHWSHLRAFSSLQAAPRLYIPDLARAADRLDVGKASQTSDDT